MKCAKCGAEITYDLGYCPYCGAEVRIVPDYNPLDDMLAEQVRDAIGGGETSENELERYRQAVQEKETACASKRSQKEEETFVDWYDRGICWTTDTSKCRNL